MGTRVFSDRDEAEAFAADNGGNVEHRGTVFVVETDDGGDGDSTNDANFREGNDGGGFNFEASSNDGNGGI